MQQTETGKKQSYLILAGILLFTLITRLWHLDYQSLWLDELHTMNEADPSLAWSELFHYLYCCDQHPPLHFILCRIMFMTIGYTAFAARLLSVLAGTAGVWAMFLLGKELMNRKGGLIAAALTAVNYYSLFYSQEARNYILVFLFATFSFLFLIKLLKTLSVRNSILYAIFSLLMLYSHYYSLFVMMSQVALIGIFFFKETAANRKVYFLRFITSGLIIGAGYLPWLPFVNAISNIKSFWIGSVAPDFLIEFFNDYFAGISLLMPIFLVLLLFFVINVFYPGRLTISVIRQQPKAFLLVVLPALVLVILYKITHALPYSFIVFLLMIIAVVVALGRYRAERTVARSLQFNPVLFSFIVLGTWIVLTYLIPYVRSLLVVPMLFPRYTIVVLPAFLIAISLGIWLIENKTLKSILLSAVLIISLVDPVFKRHYYTEISKTQFREMTLFVAENNKDNYPIINEVVSWQQQYYFKLNRMQPTVWAAKKTDLVDSILRRSSPKFYDVPAFWIIGAHGDKPLTPEQRIALDTTYQLAKEQQWHDAWAQLFVRKK